MRNDMIHVLILPRQWSEYTLYVAAKLMLFKILAQHTKQHQKGIYLKLYFVSQYV